MFGESCETLCVETVNTHFVKKNLKGENHIPLNTCVPSLIIISCEHLIKKNKGLIKVIKLCIMLGFHCVCIFFV
jgi:hypothetical protein